MPFDPDKQYRGGEDVPYDDPAWLNGLLDWIASSGIRVDPSTGLELRSGSGEKVLALAGMRRRCWARAATPIGPPSGTNDAQMTGGTVRLWFTDANGLRSDGGVDVIAYNGWPGETVPANAWIDLELREVWTVKAWECTG